MSMEPECTDARFLRNGFYLNCGNRGCVRHFFFAHYPTPASPRSFGITPCRTLAKDESTLSFAHQGQMYN